jgi:hypothetical protein
MVSGPAIHCALICTTSLYDEEGRGRGDVLFVHLIVLIRLN